MFMQWMNGTGPEHRILEPLEKTLGSLWHRGIDRPRPDKDLVLAQAPDAKDDEVPARRGSGRVRLRTLVLLRWVAIIGQTGAITIVRWGFGYELPLEPAFAAIGASVLLNLVESHPARAAVQLTDRAATIALGFDIVQLAVLLYFTGGLINPFAFLFLVPVTISATVLSLRSTAVLDILALACVSGLALFHEPLPWFQPFDLPDIYVFGIWTALTSGIVFISTYAWRIAAEARAMSDALAATHAALDRELRLAALGRLAAAAAHELGTPLGTIAVIAKEIARELPAESPLREDIDLLQSQTARCRQILGDLARRPGGDDPFMRQALPAIVEQASEPHRRDGVALRMDAGSIDDSPAPVCAHAPEIAHGLGNLVQNAVDFATGEVALRVAWDQTTASVAVEDDGPGFPYDVLARIGEPYISTRPESGGMGLGVFISKTLLERTGAKVEFGNRSGGGARVVVSWLRPVLEARAKDSSEEKA